jgi:hypothetical protein
VVATELADGFGDVVAARRNSLGLTPRMRLNAVLTGEDVALLARPCTAS